MVPTMDSEDYISLVMVIILLHTTIIVFLLCLTDAKEPQL